jgi:ribosome-associated protein
VQQNRRNNNQRDMVDFIQRPMESMVGDLSRNSNNNGLSSKDQEELNDLIRCIVKAADGRKAQDIVVLNVHHITTLCSALVILSGNSRPQNQAIAAAISSSVRDDFDGLQSGGNGVPEGNAASGWMLLDYGSVMVHIMTSKSRLYYNVEGQWKDKGGKYMDITDMLLPDPSVAQQQQQQEQQQEQASSSSVVLSEQDDPFWS